MNIGKRVMVSTDNCTYVGILESDEPDYIKMRLNPWEHVLIDRSRLRSFELLNYPERCETCGKLKL